MSGGHFDYAQYRIAEIADSIDQLVIDNDSNEKDEWGQVVGNHYPEDIVLKFKEAAHTLRRAQAMAQRVDWLVSGDDGDESFRERWAKEVPPLKQK